MHLALNTLKSKHWSQKWMCYIPHSYYILNIGSVSHTISYMDWIIVIFIWWMNSEHPSEHLQHTRNNLKMLFQQTHCNTPITMSSVVALHMQANISFREFKIQKLKSKMKAVSVHIKVQKKTLSPSLLLVRLHTPKLCHWLSCCYSQADWMLKLITMFW